MSELDDLEADLRAAGGVWFRDDLLLKLERLIEIARQGEAAKTVLQQRIASSTARASQTKFSGKHSIRV